MGEYSLLSSSSTMKPNALFIAGTALLLSFSTAITSEFDHTEPCIRVDSATGVAETFETSSESTILLERCAKTDNLTTIFRAGTIGLDTLWIECGERELISVKGEGRVEALLGDKPVVCDAGGCVAYNIFNRTVDLSAFLLEERVESIRMSNRSIPFLRTTMLSEFERSGDEFAMLMLSAFMRNINDPFRLRVLLFLESTTSNYLLLRSALKPSSRKLNKTLKDHFENLIKDHHKAPENNITVFKIIEVLECKMMPLHDIMLVANKYNKVRRTERHEKTDLDKYLTKTRQQIRERALSGSKI
ncbi:unnamed protein product [Agarophyton chilense]